MSESLALNRTGSLALELLDCSTDSVEESKKTWQDQVRIFLLSIQVPGTAEGSGETMSKKDTTAETSLEKYSRYSVHSQIAYKKKVADLFPKAVQRLRQFEGLDKNWNGEQALPPSPQTLSHAYEVLVALWQSACTKRARPPEPRVTCDARGDITFAWTLGKKELELGFSVETGIPKYEYLICSIADEPSCEEGFFEGEIVNSPTFGALFSGL